MPRFYFDVRDGPRFFADDEGRELDSLDAAEREAVTAAAQIGRDRLRARLPSKKKAAASSGPRWVSWRSRSLAGQQRSRRFGRTLLDINAGVRLGCQSARRTFSPQPQ